MIGLPAWLIAGLEILAAVFLIAALVIVTCAVVAFGCFTVDVLRDARSARKARKAAEAAWRNVNHRGQQ